MRRGREAAGYRSARDTALQNGWPESSYRAHENGSRTMGLDDAERYAKRFRAAGVNITAQSILFGLDDLVGFHEPETRYESNNQRPSPAPAATAELDQQGSLADVPLVACSDLGDGDFVALKVLDNSMNRISPPGSVIIVDRSKRKLVSGTPYVFQFKGERTYKIWNASPPCLMPYSTEATYGPTFAEKGEFRVLGQVRRTLFDI